MVDGVDIHYTASQPQVPILAIAQYQVGPEAQEDFPGIAYHFVIDASGVPAYTQDISRRVWHNGAPGHNNTKIGICYIGNSAPSEKQIEGMNQAIAWCEQTLGRSLSIEGHKDSYATSCPGNVWHLWKGELHG